MVLSLAFIIAFVGAAVALLIGITVFSQVSDSLVCPAPASSGTPTSVEAYDNAGSLGAAGDAFYFENDVSSDFVVNSTGILNEAVLQNGTATGGTNGEIILGTDPDDWRFLSSGNIGNNITSINMWINGDVVGAPVYPILGTGESDAGTGTGFYIAAQSFDIRLWAADGSGYVMGGTSVCPEPPDDGAWHMITVVMDKGNRTNDWVACWLDGVKDNGIDLMTKPFDDLTGATPLHNMTIGGGAGHGSAVTENEFNVDDLTIWQGYQLTNSDVSTLYNSGSGSAGNGIASGSIVVYHSFDDSAATGTGGTAEDGLGSDECESAKDTAWTVIGIVPIALFFALFAIFGALGRTN